MKEYRVTEAQYKGYVELQKLIVRTVIEACKKYMKKHEGADDTLRPRA